MSLLWLYASIVHSLFKKLLYHTKIVFISVLFYMLVAYFFVSSVPFPTLLNDSALQKPDPNGYIDVECHPVISIPAPHHEVQYCDVSFYYNNNNSHIIIR